MNWKYFIARKIYHNDEGGKKVSKPAIRIAMAGIAIGLAVIIVSVAVVIGFKNQVRDKVVGIGSDIFISNFDVQGTYETLPVVVNDSLLNVIQAVDGVMHVQRYSTKPGMLMTETDFSGMVLKGIGQDYDTKFLKKNMVEGEIPAFSDTVSSQKVLISKTNANKLKLKMGDSFLSYYIEGDNIRARKFIISGIYQTNFSNYDNLFLITDLYTVNRLNKWKPEQVSGIEVEVNDYSRLNDIKEAIHEKVDVKADKYGGIYFTQTVEEANPDIFAWLGLLDMNVWIILILMIGVAGFTMISGLLIIILERTNMIGVLKALGANNWSIRTIFLNFSAFLIGRGMLWGNLFGLLICFLQWQFHIIKLDPATYYVNYVPIELNIWIFLLLNICTFLISLMMLIGPSYLIAHIHPAKSIRYE
ncbi:ABC transporter permease [Phocaeicola oris]|uniref:ABC transporter permease n=1 Tax=Phocaeicola oris TaxID=2896850 RepID=UPI00234F3A6B|nr:ABC transporter permease [Phocaeicola oris]MCE2615455.1 ABC transporter permease [Phocaeicola oris]